MVAYKNDRKLKKVIKQMQTGKPINRDILFVLNMRK
jgi:hypothetical protein